MDNAPHPPEPDTKKDPGKRDIPPSLVSADRLKAIADGVFAVAMTLLVLELVVPEIKGLSNKELTEILLSMWPKFLAIYSAS